MFYLELAAVLAAVYAVLGIRVAQEYERGVVFRLGRFHKVKGPGLYWIAPIFDRQWTLDLRTRTVVGMEALARFRSLPLRAPNEWFAEAVELELGVQLEMASVRQALHALPLIPPTAYLSINCSHRAAVSPQLASVLSLDASRVVLEITEHEAVEDYDALINALKGLREQGVRVAIDDAGAGFASMRHTLQIAPDIVKLDLSLTHDIDSDRARQALASALVSFGREMGIAMVAEGIETEAEFTQLLDLGVEFGQGFFLAEPAPLHEPQF